MSTKECYYIDSEGPEKGAVIKAIGWLLSKAQNKAYIAVMGYGNFEGYIKEVLGEKTIKDLTKRDGSIRLNGINVSLITERRRLWTARSAPIVAFYPNKKFLDEVDSISEVSALLVVPWIKDDIIQWIKTRNAINVNGGDEQSHDIITDNRVVVEALKTLSALVNISTGITHPSDKETTIQVFTILRDAGESFYPDDVKSWLVRYKGWKAPEAEDVAEIVTKVLQRRKLKMGSFKFRENILDIWREEAEKNKEKGDKP